MTDSITTEAGRSASRTFPGFEERTRPLPALEPAAAAFLTRGSAVVESFRSLATRLRVLENERPLRSIGVVSAVAEEGKTLVSLGLASAFASDGSRRVLLIEADLRQRRIRNYLGMNPEPGLAEWLDRGDRRVPLMRLFPGEFGLLTAGVAPCAPEMLGSPRMAMLVEAAKQHFDVVLLDCAPLGPVADTLALQDLLDGFLFVVRARHCPRQTVLRAGNLLKPEKIVGTVLNDERLLLPTQDSYGYEYGYGRYRSYGRPDTHFVTEESARTLAPIVPASVSGGPGAGLSTRPIAAAEAPASSRAVVPVAIPTHATREPAFSVAAGPTIVHDESAEPHRRRRLAVLGLALLVLVGAGAGYLGWRGRSSPPAAPPVEPTRPTLSPETTAALERVRVLEERLKAIETEKAAAATQAAEEARKKVEAQAAARGRKADPAVVARAQEQARRQAEAEQEIRLREEQGRLQAEQRAAEERLAEERRREGEVRLADAAVPPPTTTLPAPVATPAVTAPPATAPPVTAPPVPAITLGTLVNLSEPGVIAPVLERAVQPTYPLYALRQRLEGTVQMRILVDETGSVLDAQVVTGARSRVGFDEAAVANVKGRRYRPATVDGVPVKVWLPVRVEFKLP